MKKGEGFPAFLFLFGGALIGFGLGLAYPPLAFIFAGAVCVAIAIATVPTTPKAGR